MINFLLIFYFFFFSILKFKCELICPPDNFVYEDDYWKNDPENKDEIKLGFIFKKVLREKYYDYWRGFVWDKDDFCYEPYDNSITLKTEIEDLDKIDTETIKIYNKNDNIPDDVEEYVIIDEEISNLKKFYQNGCKTVKNESDDTYQILFKMDEPIEKYNVSYFFNFSILNPYSTDVEFRFKTHTLNIIKKKVKINCENTNISLGFDSLSNEIFEEECEDADQDFVNDFYMYLNEVDTIPKHSMKKVQIPIKFSDRKNETLDNKNYFTKIYNEYISINSPSNIYNFFYNKYNLTKPFDTYITFSQFEIILEAENDLYVSSYSMTYKRNKPEELKYNGDDRTNSKDNCTNGQVCIEHYGCIDNKCQKCQDIACEKCS